MNHRNAMFIAACIIFLVYVYMQEKKAEERHDDQMRTFNCIWVMQDMGSAADGIPEESRDWYEENCRN